MSKMLIIPLGKTLTLPVGNYFFVGPDEIPLTAKFKFPDTYDDGSPLQYSGDPKKKQKTRTSRSKQKVQTNAPASSKSNPPVTNTASSKDSSAARQRAEESGQSDTKLQSLDPVHKSSSEDNGS